MTIIVTAELFSLSTDHRTIMDHHGTKTAENRVHSQDLSSD